jgi:hypothetical protein
MFVNAACGAIYVLFFSFLLSQLSLTFEPYQTCQLVGSGNHRNVQERLATNFDHKLNKKMEKLRF